MPSGVNPKVVRIICLVVAARIITLKVSSLSMHRLDMEIKVTFAVGTVITKLTFKLFLNGLLPLLVHTSVMSRKVPTEYRHIYTHIYHKNNVFLAYDNIQCDSSTLHA